MAEHTNAIISQVKLPGSETVYDIHDASAIHDISDLNLATLLKFKGAVNTGADLPSDAQIGDVYYVIADDGEYVWIDDDNPDIPAHWEALGNIHAHHHEIASVIGTNSASAVTGKGSFTPSLSVGTTKLSATATAPTISNKSTDIVLGGDTTFSTTITGSGLGTVSKIGLDVERTTDVAVGANGTAKAITGLGSASTIKAVTEVETDTGSFLTGLGTPTTNGAITGLGTASTVKAITSITPGSKSAITGLGTPTTAAAITDLNTVTPTPVSIPNVTSVGSASTWNFNVNSGVLVISGGNSVAPTLGTALTASKIDSAVATGAKSTANAITAISPTSESFLTGLGTPVTSDVVTGYANPTTDTFVKSYAPTSGSAVTGVTPTTSDVVTGYANPTTDTFLKGVKVTTQPVVALKSVTAGTGDVDVVSGVATGTLSAATTAGTNDKVTVPITLQATAPTITLKEGTTGDVEVVESVAGQAQEVNISGTAAAQTWTFSSGSTSDVIKDE